MPVDAYLDEVINEWQTQRPEARLALDFAATDSRSEIIAEHTLSQALINVLNNAADASPRDISITGNWSGDTLKLEIADRGPGLSRDVHEQLGKAPVSTKTGGLGVGLYLAYATIERLGGSLEIADREQGGTIVRITLPLLTTVAG